MKRRPRNARSNAAAPLLEEGSFEEGATAFAALVSPASSAAAPEGPASKDPVSEERLIVSRALEGHSPEARALANESDTVLWLAETCQPPAPMPAEKTTSLHERILRSVSITRPAVQSPAVLSPGRGVRPGAGAAPPVGPSETLGRMHATLPQEAHRSELIERLGMRGGAGQEPTDRALYLLIDQYWPFLGFDIVFVSTVVGDSTIHRVHRGFPADFGNIDVVPRQLSFCTHTVSAREPFLVEDSASEPFFRQSDLVQKYGARAYLGIPLFANDVVLGALCGISATPREIMPEDVELARRFARIAQALVTHDAGEVARLFAEPPAYPAAATAAVSLTARAFDDIVAAQRKRVLARPQPTWLIELPSAAWEKLPPTMLAGEMLASASGEPDPSRRRVLVPEEHPEFERVAGMLEGSERLG